MSFYKMYLRQHRQQIFVFLLFGAVFLAVFALYRVPAGAAYYPVLICAVLGVLFLIVDFRRARGKHERLLELQKQSSELMEGLFESGSWLEEDYCRIIEMLRAEIKSSRDAMTRSFADMIDYYTIWVHQIKTPISALRLYLDGEDSENARRMSEELFRIEQYVGMVLAFLRLDSESTDYVFAECELDEIIRGVIKKFAGQFIRRRLTLTYPPVCLRVVTDEKWLSFCLEQIISNALKYTGSGSISISLEAERVLTVRDTGIGIAAEDLPRVFERGYTGYHGREDKKASGIGLYLCRRICENLGHSISIVSEPGIGTAVRIDLEQKKLQVE